MNKINKLFANRGDKKFLSLYFCAGCPTLESTGDVILTMQKRGIDFIEVGIPFSDPLADGPVIQSAATKALKNGMNLKTLFAQLKTIKDQVEIPLIMMGYLNPILHYGIEAFCQSCVESGVSGAIIPDLPFKDYQEVVKPIADNSRMQQEPLSAQSLSPCSTRARMPTRPSTSCSRHWHKHLNKQRPQVSQTGNLRSFCVDTWIRTKDPHHVKVIL